VTILLLVNLERAIHGVFASSLASLGVDLSLMALLLLLSGFLYPLGLTRAWPHRMGFLTVCMLLALAFSIAALSPHITVAIVTAAAAFGLLTPVAAFLVAEHRLATVAGLAGGAAINIALRTINGTAPLGATSLGRMILLAAIVGTLAGWIGLNRTQGSEARQSTIGLRGLAAFFTFLIFEYQLMGSPSALGTLHASGDARWYLGLALGMHVGLAAGVFVVIGPWSLAGRGLSVGVPLVYVVGATGLLLGWPHSLAPFGVALTQLTAVVLVRECMTRDLTSHVSRAGTCAGLTQTIWLLFFVLHIWSALWPTLPEFLWPVLRGREAVYLLLSYGLLPALFVVPRWSTPTA